MAFYKKYLIAVSNVPVLKRLSQMDSLILACTQFLKFVRSKKPGAYRIHAALTACCIFFVDRVCSYTVEKVGGLSGGTPVIVEP